MRGRHRAGGAGCSACGSRAGEGLAQACQPACGYQRRGAGTTSQDRSRRCPPRAGKASGSRPGRRRSRSTVRRWRDAVEPAVPPALRASWVPPLRAADDDQTPGARGPLAGPPGPPPAQATASTVSSTVLSTSVGCGRGRPRESPSRRRTAGARRGDARAGWSSMPHARRRRAVVCARRVTRGVGVRRIAGRGSCSRARSRSGSPPRRGGRGSAAPGAAVRRRGRHRAGGARNRAGGVRFRVGGARPRCRPRAGVSGNSLRMAAGRAARREPRCVRNGTRARRVRCGGVGAARGAGGCRRRAACGSTHCAAGMDPGPALVDHPSAGSHRRVRSRPLKAVTCRGGARIGASAAPTRPLRPPRPAASAG